MKKILSLSIALMLILQTIAFADVLSKEWKTATDEELSAAIEIINDELKNRKVEQQPKKEEGTSQDCKVTAIGVGSTTQSLSYEVVDSGLSYWKDSDDYDRFAFVAIKNTDTKAIYLKSCNMDFEDKDGHLIESTDFVSNCPDVIDPGEIGYFYVSGVNGGYFDEGVDLSNGCNLVAQFSLQASKETVTPYEVSDTKLSFTSYFGDPCPVVTGRVKNTSDEDDDMFYINCILKNADGKIFWISGTNVMNLYAGVQLGFEISVLYGSPDLTPDNIKSYEVIAEPSYYQYK